MRIAVSGTHSAGKSTLIDAFLRAHPDYDHEPEPYAMLVEDYGEEFSAQPTVDDFYRQLQFNLERLKLYRKGDRVICERCPLDFLAYILALKELGIEHVDSCFVDDVRMMVAGSLRSLDVIAFLRMDDSISIEPPEEEDTALRNIVDARLVHIFDSDEFDLDSFRDLTIVEAIGSTAQRLVAIERAMKSQLANQLL